ncbi:hypothetical protein D3C73_1472110 [compost metagenome]
MGSVQELSFILTNERVPSAKVTVVVDRLVISTSRQVIIFNEFMTIKPRAR